MTYDRDAVPTLGPGLRLLPWETDTGKPCFLSTDSSQGALSRLADEIEEDQLRDGGDVLKGARAVQGRRVRAEERPASGHPVPRQRAACRRQPRRTPLPAGW